MIREAARLIERVLERRSRRGMSPPESQMPVSLVVLCSDGPLFIHVTVVPTFTVSTAGEKLKS